MKLTILAWNIAAF